MNIAIPLADWSLLLKLIDRSFTMRQVNLSCLFYCTDKCFFKGYAVQSTR